MEAEQPGSENDLNPRRLSRPAEMLAEERVRVARAIERLEPYGDLVVRLGVVDRSVVLLAGVALTVEVDSVTGEANVFDDDAIDKVPQPPPVVDSASPKENCPSPT
jgi:hypothetical protein